MSDVDFRVQLHGSVWTIIALSDAAKAFAEENLPVEGWQGTPQHFSTDHRVAMEIARRLQEDGFTVDR